MEDTNAKTQQPSLTSASLPTIAELARSCDESFQACLNKAASFHPHEMTLVEDQITRFSVWAANIGVFVHGRGSLDHRLREAPDVQDAVGGLLEALELRAQNCLDILDSLSLKVAEEPTSAVDPSFNQIVEGISKDISLLHKFSNTIRRASREAHKLQVTRSFRIQDDEGNDVESFLQQIFALNVRDRFPEVSFKLQQRLANTMLLRRKMMLYRRSRYGRNHSQDQVKHTQPTASNQRIRLKGGNNLPQNTDRSQDKLTIHKTPKSGVRSIAITATTLAPEQFKKASTPSVVSLSKTVALSSHNDLRFPPAPCGVIIRRYNRLKAQREDDLASTVKGLRGDGKRAEKAVDASIADAEAAHRETLRKDWESCLKAVGEVVCPFCFCTLPVSEVSDDKKWREHVKGDLYPYVCLFEDCGSGEELYAHSHTWLKHMREHTTRWNCKSKAHATFTASSKENYLNHMREAHSGKFNDAQLEVLAHRNSRSAGSLFQTCPLCGTTDVACIEDHLVGHMRLLALVSLPSYEEDNGKAHVDSESQPTSGSSARARSRSTLKNAFGSDSESASFPYVGEDIDTHSRASSTDSGQSSNSNVPYSLEGRTQKQTSATLPDDNGNERDRKFKSLNPDCAFCHESAEIECLCESKFLDDAVAQAEKRMMYSIYDQIRSWVRDKSQDYVRTSFRQSLVHTSSFLPEKYYVPGDRLKLQPTEEDEASGLDQPLEAYALQWEKEISRRDTIRWSIKSLPLENQPSAWEAEMEQRRLWKENHTEILSKIQPTAEDTRSQQLKVNHLWQDACIRFPEVLEYYYCLTDLTLPPDDDPAIRDPPLNYRRVTHERATEEDR